MYYLCVKILLTYFFILIAGAVAGNICTTLLYRVPRKINIFAILENKYKPFCSCCKHQLRYFEVLPLIGWLINRGSCRYCKRKIDPSYFILELCSGIISILLYNVFGLSEVFLILLLFSCALLLQLFMLRLHSKIYMEITIFIVILGLIMMTLLQHTMINAVFHLAMGAAISTIAFKKGKPNTAQIILIFSLWINYIFGLFTYLIEPIINKKRHTHYVYIITAYIITAYITSIIMIYKIL